MSVFSLKNQKEFDLVNKHGYKKHNSHLIIVLAKNLSHMLRQKSLPPGANGPVFFGMKVSKKLSKKAVIRNKIRRRVRHLVRNIYKLDEIHTKNTAFIIIPKKGFDKVNFSKLNTDFDNLFSRLLSLHNR